MAQGIIGKDRNWQSVVGAVSAASDTAATARALQYDVSSRGLTVHIVGDDVGSLGVIELLSNP